jgi:ChrR Cupin-like domain
MSMNKPHLEFTPVDLSDGWATPAGYPAGIQQKILASDLDERRRTGSRTRLLRFEPGTYTTAPFVHDHWEEVYLVSGDLIVGNDAYGGGGESFAAPTYACRPPGVRHGPFKSKDGCILFEIHYYDPADRKSNHPRNVCYQCKQPLPPDYRDKSWNIDSTEHHPMFDSKRCKDIAIRRHLHSAFDFTNLTNYLDDDEGARAYAEAEAFRGLLDEYRQFEKQYVPVTSES